MEELLANMREAIELCLEVQGESEPYIKEIVGIQKVAVWANYLYCQDYKSLRD